jgi:hypothetical protein
VRAVIVAVAIAIIGLANLTGAVDTITAKWRVLSPTIGPTIRALTPWLLGFLVFCCAISLLVHAYSEWRDRKGAHKRARLSEIETIASCVKYLCRTVEACFGPEPDHTMDRNDLTDALERSVEVLVQSCAYEKRSSLYNYLRGVRINIATGEWSKIEPSVIIFRQWLNYAEQELHGAPPVRRVKDPFAPQLRD